MLLLMLLLDRRHLLLLLYRRTLLLLFPNNLDVRDSSALHRPLRPSRTTVREEDVLERQNTSGGFSHFAVQDGVGRLLERELDGRASKVGHGRGGWSSRDARRGGFCRVSMVVKRYFEEFRSESRNRWEIMVGAMVLLCRNCKAAR